MPAVQSKSGSCEGFVGSCGEGDVDSCGEVPEGSTGALGMVKVGLP